MHERDEESSNRSLVVLRAMRATTATVLAAGIASHLWRSRSSSSSSSSIETSGRARLLVQWRPVTALGFHFRSGDAVGGGNGAVIVGCCGWA